MDTLREKNVGGVIANLVQVLGGELELTVMVLFGSGPRCFNLIL